MIFTPLDIPGAWIVDWEPKYDERGYFARTWCAEEFSSRGMTDHFVQSNTAYNSARGTLRGMHYQASPHGENKLVRCARGGAYFVILDLRPDSPVQGKWLAIELTAENRRQLWIPKGCALGYQTLVDHTEIDYQMTAAYVAEAARGVRYDEAAYGIVWPLEVTALSLADRNRKSEPIL